MKTLNGKKLTGYPSIDRPWLKYYPKKPIRKFVLEQKMCNLIETANIDNLDNIAINFMGIDGNDWTYREIFHMVDRLADAYLQYGLKEKEVVLVSTVSGLDEALNLLALNKIGAISKWIDITASAMDLETAIVEDNCRIVVAFAAVVPELQKCIDDTTVERVLYSSPEQYIRTNKMPPEQRNFLQKGILEESLVMPQDERFIRLMQEIWAKLLVKEHIENGSVPYAMLNILALMDRNSALAFQKICALTYILDDDDMGRHYIPLVLYDDMLHNIIEHNLQHDTYIQIYKIMTEYEQYLPAQQDLQFLEELGLLKLSTLHDESEIFSHKHRKVRYQVGDKCIETESLHSDDYEYEFVLVGQAFYTQIGEKLYHALAVEPFQKLFDVLELFCCFNEEMEV